MAYTFGMGVSRREKGDILPLAGSVVEVLRRTRTGFMIHPGGVEELVDHCRSLVANFNAGERSFISVPLIFRDEVIGALHIRSRQPNLYTDRELQLAKQIGDQIAGAIANAQLYAELRKTEISLKESGIN